MYDILAFSNGGDGSAPQEVIDRVTRGMVSSRICIKFSNQSEQPLFNPYVGCLTTWIILAELLGAQTSATASSLEPVDFGEPRRIHGL